MTDRELLEAAARAAGRSGEAEKIEFDMGFWNPLESDADAFRLMVELRLEVHCDSRFDEDGEIFACVISQCGNHMAFGSSDDDPKDATRLAIVRCAAALAQTPST